MCMDGARVCVLFPPAVTLCFCFVELFLFFPKNLLGLVFSDYLEKSSVK